MWHWWWGGGWGSNNQGIGNTIHRAQPVSRKFAWARVMFIQRYSLHLEMCFWPWDNSNQDLHEAHSNLPRTSVVSSNKASKLFPLSDVCRTAEEGTAMCAIQYCCCSSFCCDTHQQNNPGWCFHLYVVIPELKVTVKKVNWCWKQALFSSDLQSQWPYNPFHSFCLFSLQVVLIVASASCSTEKQPFQCRFWNLFRGKKNRSKRDWSYSSL